MVEEPTELKKHIWEQRNRIDRSLHQLEDNLGQAADWKTYVRAHPWWAVGGGFAAGLVLAGVAKSGHTTTSSSEVHHEASMLRSKIDSLFGAAVGVVSDAVEEAAMNAFPILRSRYRKLA
jgi:hypothetical protein